MPTAYVSGSFEAVVTFSSSKEWSYKQWIDQKEAMARKEYGHSNLTVWFEISNPEDPISPFTVPVHAEDFYEGTLTFIQSGLKFIISFDGKAKATVHKLTLAKINEGVGMLNLTGLDINGAQISTELEDEAGHSVVINQTTEFIASSKKIK